MGRLVRGVRREHGRGQANREPSRPLRRHARGLQDARPIQGLDACQGNNAENDSVKVCFHPDGEWLYVQDKDADGRSAYGQISNRDRHCRNPCGKGAWVRCNYSFTDGHTVAFRGYTRDNEGAINIMRNETPYTADLA